ncbi:hypothetical protein J1N09_14860 [Aureitalea sp. L0-47]|uniref:hypothetical protein n=1 Tax=Aureitalea sp. L0-47 TaxID=2816962 RepID=UPI00223753A0|nr:hypothetical protein [Aureitalea sp. L0-47]MCW5521127.1 hypothetical protein [Aureitalea sp. L0-47]
MLKEFLEDVFQRALEEGAPETANGIATHIHQALDEKVKGQPLGVDSIRSYYTKWKNGKSVSLSKASKNDLAVYLGDTNFKAYTERKQTKKVNTKRYIYAMSVMVFVIGFLLVDRFRPKCMIWSEDRYERCACSEDGSVDVDPIKLKKFRKLVVKCEIEFFFDKEGKPKVFYYKKGDKDLELFNMPTWHPENGEVLRKITPHMIREHLCSSL